jgi:hypothetical protein
MFQCILKQEKHSYHLLFPVPLLKTHNTINPFAMDVDRLQEIEKQLAKQIEISQTTNDNIAKPFAMISNMEVKNIALPLPAIAPPTPHVTTIPSTSQPLQIRPAVPNNLDGDRVKGHAFLTCELYMLITALKQIHWVLSFCKTGCAATFAERIVRQEMKTRKIIFTSCTKFMNKFKLIFCLEN